MNPDLFRALKSHDKKTLDELLGPGEDAALLGVTPEGNTALHIVASLELAKEICEREISLLTAPNARLDTPMHCAARAGDHKMVSLLIEFATKGGIEAATVLKATNWEQNNALHEAAKYGHALVAKELLMQEDAGLTCMLNGAGMSPLYLAIATGSLGVAKALLLQPSSEVMASPAFRAGPDQKTALHAAVLCSEITEDLLKRMPTTAKDVDSSGKIPLHYAVSYGHRHMVKLLLDHDRSTAYVPDSDGSFPIHIAASMGNVDIVDQILQQCPDAEELLDKDGKNFLHVAMQRDLVKKSIGKRPHLRKLLNEQDKKGNTPLHTAIEKRDEWMVYYLVRHKSVNLNIMNRDGFTPLDLAHSMLIKGDVKTFAMSRIAKCLALANASIGPRALDDLERLESYSSEGKAIKRVAEYSKSYGIISVLIATVTFAAGFTLPGGYIADGKAVLAEELNFRGFLVCDTFAFAFSIATGWLILAGTTGLDRPARERIILGAAFCVDMAVFFVCGAFAMGICVVLPSSSKILGDLLGCFVIAASFLAQIMVPWNAKTCFSNAVWARQGWRHWIRPTTHPLFKHRFPRGRLLCMPAILQLLSCIAFIIYVRLAKH